MPGDARPDLRRRPQPPDRPVEALHQRLDRLTDSWVGVAPARNVRPHASLDRTCPFCPGGREVPGRYRAAVLENAFPTLRADPPAVPPDPRLRPSVGRCEVVLYTERHGGSLGTLTPDELADVIAVWRDRSTDLWADPRHAFVMVFENRGEPVGATLAHPHGQVYAFDHLPPVTASRVRALAGHAAASGDCLSCRVVGEDAASERVIRPAGSFVVAVPFAPRWPFEVHVRARRHGLRRLGDLRPEEERDLASALRDVVRRYDALFGFPLPYMMTAQEGPADVPDWHLSFEFLPPQRTERLTKVRASVETATGYTILDATPEASAARLAALDVPGEPAAEPVRVVRA